jgi:hypothetical protein
MSYDDDEAIFTGKKWRGSGFEEKWQGREHF